MGTIWKVIIVLTTHVWKLLRCGPPTCIDDLFGTRCHRLNPLLGTGKAKTDRNFSGRARMPNKMQLRCALLHLLVIREWNNHRVALCTWDPTLVVMSGLMHGGTHAKARRVLGNAAGVWRMKEQGRLECALATHVLRYNWSISLAPSQRDTSPSGHPKMEMHVTELHLYRHRDAPFSCALRYHRSMDFVRRPCRATTPLVASKVSVS